MNDSNIFHVTANSNSKYRGNSDGNSFSIIMYNSNSKSNIHNDEENNKGSSWRRLMTTVDGESHVFFGSTIWVSTSLGFFGLVI